MDKVFANTVSFLFMNKVLLIYFKNYSITNTLDFLKS